jgi:hypothetical protein
MRGVVIRKVLGNLTVACLTIAATGCATIYKSTAGDYVDAAKQITTALQNAEQSRSNADSQAKFDLIVEDRSCPVQRPFGLYLRPAALGASDIPPGFFAGAIKKARLDSTGANATACRKLASCDTGERCAGKCLDAEESTCIDQLKHYYSTSAAADDKAIAAQLGNNVARISYPEKSADTYLATSSIQALSAYLDLLAKAADGKVQDFKTDAGDLANGFKSAEDAYKQISGQNLVSSETSTAAINSVNALGAVIQDIATLVQTAKDTAAIKAAVNKYDKDVDTIMTNIEAFVVADIQLAGAETDINNARRFSELQRQFSTANSVLERRAVMGKVRQLYTDNVMATVKSTHAVFKKAEEAHATLVQLINDPTNDQLKQIRAQEFASFRSTATDVGALIALFVK